MGNAEVAGVLEKAYQLQKGALIKENKGNTYFRSEPIEVYRINPALFNDVVEKLKEMEVF